MDFLIGLDLGTSAIKGVLIAVDGRILAQARRETALLRPTPGRVEFSSEDYYERVCDVLRELATGAPDAGSIRGLSMAVAGGNTVLLDESGSPLCPAISWLDRRAEPDAQALLPGLRFDSVHRVVGWPFRGSFPLAHLAWLKQHRPEEWGRTALFGLNLTYVLFRLTGAFGIDVSTATTFFLQDQVGDCWHEPFLSLLGITEESLPARMPTGARLGRLTAEAAGATGLPESAEVVLGAFDHPCAARGEGVLEPGDVLLSCGTSWVGFTPVVDRDAALGDGLLVDPFLRPDGPWGAMFALTAIGVVVEEYVDAFIAGSGENMEDKYAAFNRAAESAPPGANGLVLNLTPVAHLPPGREEELRNEYTKGDIARAVMEAVVFRLAARIEALASSGFEARRITMVGGPTGSRLWPQIVADVTGLDVRLSAGRNAGALGAAILAGVGVKVFSDERDGASRFQGNARTICPNPDARHEYNALRKKSAYEGAV